MKYGILFLVLGVLTASVAFRADSQLLLLLLWPTGNFLVIGIAYLTNCPKVFGKRPNGTLNRFVVFAFLPYLLFLWMVWDVVRRIQIEEPFHHLNDKILIGRRLRASEMPAGIDNVLDLTCEFAEPSSIVSDYTYISFPILDASAPSLQELEKLVRKIDSLKGNLYIHCAQGHGRTGLVTSALLLYQKKTMSVENALEQLKACRPLLKCNKAQLDMLREFHQRNSGQ